MNSAETELFNSWLDDTMEEFWNKSLLTIKGVTF